MLVLGIETSCDETGIALYDSDRGLLADALHSQVDIHAEFGGVVPELASRDHIRKLIPLVRQVLAEVSLDLQDLGGIAYTAGPGLVGALMVGAGFGRTLAWALDIPAIAVHHMEAHLLAPLIEQEQLSTKQRPTKQRPTKQRPTLPFIALLVSGGHTLLVQVNGIGDYQLLGESLDDAVGEAFDKAAKMLDLGYPGGPHLARCAESGDPARWQFPRPMTDRPGLDFSFSGLKTFTLNTIRAISEKGPLSEQDRADVARAFEEAVVATLVIKCRRALAQTGLKQLLVAGGVSANQRLRAQLKEQLDAQLIYAPLALCTDNGAMIAYAGALRLRAGEREPLGVRVRARWPLVELNAVAGPP